jgi:site-specific DNA recombinase
MDTDIIPAHIHGRHMGTFLDPVSTVNQDNLEIGGYVRVSTKKDAQKSSVENQKKLLQQWAEMNKYNLVKMYVDRKSGGFAYSRDDLQEMLKDLKDGRIKGVAAKEICRTSRDVQDLLALTRKIQSYGGFFVSMRENYDSRTDGDEFLLVIHAALAQKEKKQTAGRVKLTQMLKAKDGKTNVPHPAYGYMLTKDKQHLTINPATAPTLRFIIEKFIEGWGQLRLSKYLNIQGIPSSHGKKWGGNAIRTIVNNPVYLGITISNVTTAVRDASGKRIVVIRPKEEWIICKETHEPLMTKEEFEKIQQIVRERQEKDVKQWSCERKYLGSAVLRCGVCGGRLYGNKTVKTIANGRDATPQYYLRYVCQNRNGQCDAKMHIWHMDRVDKMIMDLFVRIFSDRQRLIETIKSQVEILSEENEVSVSERAEYSVRLEQVQKALKKQQIAFEQDAINLDEYKQRLDELRQEKQLCAQKLQRLNETLNKSDLIKERVEMIYASLADRLDHIDDLSDEEKAAFIDNAFESISISPDYQIADVSFRL